MVTPDKMALGRQILGLVIFLAITFAVTFISAQFRPGPWYAQLIKPSWTPPSWLFPPVWTTLYAMMAIAAWLVWREGTMQLILLPLAAYFLQLLANGLWSWIFFGQHRIGTGLVDIIVLWVLIFATIVLFWKVRPLAGALLIPYLLWVTYATALNYEIWRVNG